MATYCPHQVASRQGNDAHQADDGLAKRVLNQVRQSFCGMHGHDSMVQFEHERMFLRCVSCGHESPGWTLDKTPLVVKTRDNARRHALSRRLVGVRRIA
jgi:hypothetical protein